MISRSFLSCPLNCAIQRTLTLAWRWRRRNRRYYLYCHMDHMDGRDGWSHQHYQRPYQHRDHPSLQCERSPSWVERHECWVWWKYYCKTTVLLEIHAGLAAGCCVDDFPDSVTLRVVFTDATHIGRRPVPWLSTCNPRKLVMPWPRALYFRSAARSVAFPWFTRCCRVEFLFLPYVPKSVIHTGRGGSWLEVCHFWSVCMTDLGICREK